jgi:hypothetical protein
VSVSSPVRRRAARERDEAIERRWWCECNLGRCSIPLEKSHYNASGSGACQRQFWKGETCFTRINLLSSPTLPKRYVRPSQRRSSKASADKKDECPWQRAMTRCSHGEKMFTKSSWPPVLPEGPISQGRSPLNLMDTHDNKPAVW